MNRLKVYINVKEKNIREKNLFVKVTIKGMETGLHSFYVGSIKPFNVKCNYEYIENNNFIDINKLDNSDLVLQYDVKVSKLGKHGHAGELNKDILVFSGDQVFILPTKVLSLKDRKDNTCESISIKVESNKKVVYMPFNKENQSIKEEDIVWNCIYKIMKDNYILGRFNKCFERDNMQIITEEELELSFEVKENIYRLYKYYCDLFKCYSKELKLILLNESKEDEIYIVCGCGGDSICATFDFNNKRDWQLLSHRMFHNFMDFIIKSKEFHVAPNLWLTEGLATYYEINALDNLNFTLKNNLNISSDNEFKNIFLRYLYMKFKNRELLEISPMDEGSLRSFGKIEFLHYTIAPLIVKYIEDIVYKNRKEKDNIITYIINMKCNELFNMEHLFLFLLEEKKDSFAIKYLFNSEVIPLWYLSDGKENKDEIIKSINEYDYILYSWFLKEGINYEIINAKIEDIKEEYDNISNKLNLRFSNILMENMVKKSSYTIYILLKKYYLSIYI